MLCEIDMLGNFMLTWATMIALGFLSIMVMSGTIFYIYYQHPTYDMWRRKSNPDFPKAENVKNEIIQMIKGMWSASFAPCLSVWLARHGYGKAYCGVQPYGWGYLAATFVLCWLVSDLFEFLYHRLGHITNLGWKQHKWHHLFYNPTPFAVIADEYVDQAVRSAPMLFLPLLLPVNIDMLFGIFAIFFYAYGVYLHWGFELSYPDAHHPWINTAFQHYLHHAISVKNKPYHTGFYFKIWDQLFGSCYTGPCFCCKCAEAKGERSKEKYDEIMKTKPDYSVLLSLKFWMQPREALKAE